MCVRALRTQETLRAKANAGGVDAVRDYLRKRAVEVRPQCAQTCSHRSRLLKHCLGVEQ
jgi:hypothetical protein